jgi:hypothetical protein
MIKTQCFGVLFMVLSLTGCNLDSNDQARLALLKNSTEITLRDDSVLDKNILRLSLVPQKGVVPNQQQEGAVYARALCRRDLGNGTSQYWSVEVTDCASATINNNTVFGNSACGADRGGNIESCR